MAKTKTNTTTAPAAAEPKKGGNRKPKATPAPAPEPTPAPVVEEAAPVVELTLEERFKAEIAHVDSLMGDLKKTRQALVALSKASAAAVKAAQKAGGRRRKPQATHDADGNPLPKRAPSGITKPAKVSDAMCKFMGVAPGTLVARTDVTKFITNYIKENNLKDQQVKRQINPDTKLRNLLELPTDVALNYFNLQTFMSKHFQKAQATA